MKIAICISGHLRNYSLSPILLSMKERGINFDTFVSTWNTSGKRINMYEHEKNQIDFSNVFIPNLKKIEVEDDSTKVQEILHLYNQYENVIEPGNYVAEKEFERKYQILSMFRKCHRSIDLVDDEYDLVIRTRFDCVFDLNEVFKYIQYLKEIDSILVPINWSAGDETHPGGGRICDSFAFGPSHLIKKYGKVYDYIKSSETSQYMLNNNVWFCPHSILLHHLMKQEVNYIKQNIGYDVTR